MVAQLPLMHDPLIKCSSNKDNALKVFIQQLKKLSKGKKDVRYVISS